MTTGSIGEGRLSVSLGTQTKMGKETMTIGWLWLDASKSTLEQKVTYAADQYRTKFGHKPNMCYVHPSAVDGELRVNGLRVAAAGHVLLHHFWLGVEDENIRQVLQTSLPGM